ncbi:M23 family metallopeptidase [Aurantiacibacter sp. D1-12]|uniref:M23 family metallopeptidase n=1 Tax=Aurantiacibacter sp. D1-12 TaxID=2993658 RepID=UPI00237CC8E6|nr:M23 family metallopeptidase [Aurantiacibacter sp. D1-12]MDE1467935.1 M23 family metallopeptidase [Aurantiacibacter sp. D1-12]
MRSLGIAEEGVEDLGNAQFNQYVEDEQGNIAQGALDVQSDSVDDEMMERSLGYRNAVTKGRTVTGFTEAAREFSDELETVLEAQDSPLLEVRRSEALGMTERFFENFAVNPETGELREYLQSPGAMRYLAETIQTVRPQFEANAIQRIEERFNREALSHFSQNVVNQVEETGVFDVEAALSLLPDTVTDEEASETLLTSVFNAYNVLRSAGRREEAVALLASVRGHFDTPVDAGEATARPSGLPSTGGNREVLRMPVQGRITSEFGEGRGNGTHNGVDIAVPVGTPVPAAMGGEVLRVWTADRGGLSMRVRYDDGTVVGFAHLSETNFEAGARVSPGDTLVLTGNSGQSTGPHLHYTVTRDGQKMNPLEAEFGPVSVDASAVEGGAPPARLRDPNEDPITALENSGEIVPIPGLDQVHFSADQVARLNQFYREATASMRREWNAANEDRYAESATNLALGMFGTGDRITTREDILRAFENGEVDGEAVMTLIRLHEGREDRIESRRERAESRAEREERRRQANRVNAGSEVLIGRMIRGELSPAQARQAALGLATRLDDTEVASALIASVNSAAGSYESALQNSAPVRDAMAEYAELAEDPSGYLAGLNLPRHRMAVAEEAFIDILDRAQGRLMRRLMDGEDPQEAREAVEGWVAQQERLMVQELTPSSPQY